MTESDPGGSVWLGVDLGTQGVRAVAVDAAGSVAGAGQEPLRHDLREGPRHEQDPAEWWTATCAAVRGAVAGLRGRPVAAVAVDSTSGTLVVQDRRGLPAGPAWMYDDTRAASRVPAVQEAGSSVWTALGYRMQAAWALPKLVELCATGAVAAGHTVVHQADHVVARLAGRPVATDTSHALKTGYDLLADRWPTDVLDRLGVDPAVLPDVVVPGTRIASVSAAAAAECGLPAGTPIVAGMTDGCAAQVATGALAPGRWCSALGTTLVLKGATPELVHDASGGVYCHRHPDGGWLPGGASNVGAGVLSRDLPGVDPGSLAPAPDVPPGAMYPLVGRGERFPFTDPGFGGFDVGGPASPTAAETFARVAHGVAFVEKLAFDVLAGLGADVSGPVVATGGTSRNEWWTQLRADVLGRPVSVPEQAGSAFGAAILAAAPPGSLARTAAAMVRLRATVDPRPGRTDLSDGCARFRAELTTRGLFP